MKKIALFREILIAPFSLKSETTSPFVKASNCWQKVDSLLNRETSSHATIEKSEFESDELLRKLLEKNILVKNEKNSKTVYFDKLITTQTLLEKRLKKIEGIKKNQRIIELWETSCLSTCYGEYCYFHPFVQKFLYNNSSKSTKPALEIFQRTDIKKVKVAFTHNKKAEELSFNIDRVHLYKFDVDVVVLIVEISKEDIKLEHAQIVLDQFRRLYPPFLEANGDPGKFPDSVTWIDKNEKELFGTRKKDSWVNSINTNKPVPIAEHWKHLLYNNEKQTDILKLKGHKHFKLEHLGDDRIPIMAYLAFDDPSILTDGDFMRLCTIDAPEVSTQLPFSRRIEKEYKQYYYDRFWDPETSGHEWMRNRFLCCGYSFVMIGKNEQSESYSFFTDNISGALSHFRHHYLQMGIIVHLQNAALLNFSKRLSEIIEKFKKDEKKLREKIKELQEDLLYFVNYYWFVDISNQLQARELYDLWKKHLGSVRWYKQITQEIRDINDFLDAGEQKKQTEKTLTLTIVAAAGLAMTLAQGSLSFWPNHFPQIVTFLLGSIMYGLVLFLFTQIGIKKK